MYARAKYKEENVRMGIRGEGELTDAYLARYVGYVNVIIPQILRGELSRARAEEGGTAAAPRRIDHKSASLKYR